MPRAACSLLLHPAACGHAAELYAVRCMLLLNAAFPCMLLLNAACHLRSGVQVDAELSVPAVTALLLSAAALALSATADQLMSGGLTRTAHEALVAAGPLGTGGCCTVCRWTVGAAAWGRMGGGAVRAMLCGWGRQSCWCCVALQLQQLSNVLRISAPQWSSRRRSVACPALLPSFRPLPVPLRACSCASRLPRRPAEFASC